LKARLKFEKEEPTQQDLIPLEDEVVNKVVQMQMGAGMRPIIDNKYQ